MHHTNYRHIYSVKLHMSYHHIVMDHMSYRHSVTHFFQIRQSFVSKGTAGISTYLPTHSTQRSLHHGTSVWKFKEEILLTAVNVACIWTQRSWKEDVLLARKKVRLHYSWPSAQAFPAPPSTKSYFIVCWGEGMVIPIIKISDCIQKLREKIQEPTKKVFNKLETTSIKN